MRARKLFEGAFYLCLFFVLFHYVFSRCFYSIPYCHLVWYRNTKAPHSWKSDSIKKAPAFDNRKYNFQRELFYYDRKGEVEHRLILKPEEQVSASIKNYITYQKMGNQLSMWDWRGYPLWNITSFGYPFLSPLGNRFVLLSTDNTSISLYDSERNLILPKTFLDTMITDFQFCPFNDNLWVGTSSGLLLLIDYQGRFLFEKNIQASRYNYVKSVFIAADGSYYGALVGLYPEWLILYDKNGRELWRRDTKRDRRRRFSIFIDHLGKQVLEQDVDSIICRSLKTGAIRYELSTKSLGCRNIQYLKASFVKNKTMVAVTDEEKNWVLLLTKDGEVLWKHSYTESYLLHVEIHSSEEYILIHSSTHIYCYKINQ